MSRKTKVLIIDDEALARDMIRQQLAARDDVKICEECANGFDGIKAIQEHQPDLIFLDIQMPKLTGFEMLELLDDPPIIIFCTAYDQYALKAFEVSAVDYLLKPFSGERFNEALDKGIAALSNRTAQTRELEKLQTHNDQATEPLDRIVIKSGHKIRVIPLDDLLRVEAQDDYVMLHCREGRFLKPKTMKYFENRLPSPQFIRIHRSHIVRLAAIKELDAVSRGSYEITLQNGERLPVSRSGYQRLKELSD